MWERLWTGGRHFNPPSPCGEGQAPICNIGSLRQFQSTLPVWGGTPKTQKTAPRVTISIHPPRVGRDDLPAHVLRRLSISIHPPRVGRDVFFVVFICIPPYFNPPSPCGEGLRSPSARFFRCYFNPPSPCGEGRRSANPRR